MAEEEVPWPDEAPDDDSEASEQEDDRDSIRGIVTDWENPKGNAPAKLKIGGTKSQVWPYAFGDEEREDYSDVFKALKKAAIEDGAVEAVGEYKSRSFYSEKAKKNISTTTFTVYEADPIEVTAEMKKAGDVAKKAVPAKGASRGKGDGSGKYKGLTPEEWDEKDRKNSAKIRSAWAVQTAVTALVVGKGEPPSMEAIEKVAFNLVEIAARVEADLLSGSASPTASPSTTTAEAKSSAPAAKESAPSKPSRKRSKTSEGA